jgi:lauroyl/myristoyl acyltransferase
MQQVLAEALGRAELRGKINKNILYRKWLKTLVYAWPNWANRCADWVGVEGEEHLQAALASGKGAILLSGHAYGFSKLVAPVLTRMNYSVHRGGSGARGDRVRRWGREPVHVSWKYINYGDDYWRHLRALKQMHHALENNHVLHVSIRGFPRGEARLAIDFCYKGFFLDPLLLRTIEILGSPVLPLFAVCDSTGYLRLKIYPSLAPRADAVMQVFAPLYARYLRELPEFSRIWRRVVQQMEGW